MSGVELPDTPHQTPDPFGHSTQGIGHQSEPNTPEEKFKKVVKCPLLDRQASLHVGLTTLHLRIEKNFPSCCPIVNPDGKRLARAIPVIRGATLPVNHPEKS